MSNRHRVFVSYHHRLDEEYKTLFERRFGDVFEVILPGSVSVGDIDPSLPNETIRQKIRDDYLSDTTVTIVLIGAQTWQRMHIDWEIGSSIRDTKHNPRSGLLGILLPTYPRNDQTKYKRMTIPPRLYDNVKCGFAAVYNWSNDPAIIQTRIHKAYLRKSTEKPDNSRASFDRDLTGSGW